MTVKYWTPEVPVSYLVEWDGTNFEDLQWLTQFFRDHGQSMPDPVNNGDGTAEFGGGTIHTGDWVGAVQQVQGAIQGVGVVVNELYYPLYGSAVSNPNFVAALKAAKYLPNPGPWLYNIHPNY